MSPLIDFIVTRKPTDPIDYRRVVQRVRGVNLIEVDFAPSIQQARMDVIKHGTAPFVVWFDPDDELYPHALPTMMAHIKHDISAIAVLMLSDVQLPSDSIMQISPKKFTMEPAHAHLFRCISRKWLEDNIESFDHPVSEWVPSAMLIKANAKIIPVSAFKWNPGPHGDHNTMDPVGILKTRKIVQGILGSKYDYSVKYNPSSES